MVGRVAGTLVFLSVTAAISFALIEVGARIWLTRWASEDQFAAYASLDQIRARAEEEGDRFSKFERHHYLGFVGSPNYRRGKNRHNDLGFRGDPIPKTKPKGEYRIVCLGGSTTYTSMVHDYEQSFPHRLEGRLQELGHPNVRVINAGVPGYTSYETLISFAFRVLDLDPDMIVVYHAANDALARLVWPPTAYLGDNSGFKKPSLGLEEPETLLKRSTALRTLLVATGRTEPAGALNRTFSTHASTYYGFDFGFQHRNGVYPLGIFRTVDAATMLDENPPVYFERNLEHLLLIARHHDVQPVLATFAAIDRREGGDESSAPEIRYAIDEINRIILRVGADFGVPVFDFARSFPRDLELFVGGVHLNRQGAKIKADLFARYLNESDLISTP